MADLLRGLGASFGGVHALQSWADFLLWELVLNERPDVRAIVEIGTFKGGFSRYLHAQAEARGMAFATYDFAEPVKPPPGFSRVDVFESQQLVRARLSSLGPVALLVDGGDKPAEVALFAPSLVSGSVVVVHDWLVEFGPADIPACLAEAHADLCDELGSLSRVFERK